MTKKQLIDKVAQLLYEEPEWQSSDWEDADDGERDRYRSRAKMIIDFLDYNGLLAKQISTIKNS